MHGTAGLGHVLVSIQRLILEHSTYERFRLLQTQRLNDSQLCQVK